DFIDAFILGDAENNLVEILRMYASQKKSGMKRAEILKNIAKKYDSVYVPELYEFVYENDELVAVNPKFTDIGDRQADYVLDFDKAQYPLKPLVPVVESIHSRAVLEIMRGCTQGCRFCQAGMAYRPQRFKSAETLLNQAKEILANTGYEELSLLSLSSSDYPHLKTLTGVLNQRYATQNISIALPSLRVDDQIDEIIEKTGLVRNTGLTIAPEAATERLRRVINKNITDNDLLEGCKTAFSKGYARLKLYFMLGLPTETDEDAVAIANLLKKLLEIARTANPRRKPRIRVTLSPFVPKPHTPFHWLGQTPIEILRKRIKIVTSEMSRLRHLIEINWHDPESSVLEAAMSRGDPRLSKVILNAFQNGAIFDNWDSHFNFKIWEKSFADAGFSIHELAQKTFSLDDTLPWQHLQTDISLEYMKNEYQKAMNGETTLNCHDEGCNVCGMNPQFCFSDKARPEK
ncbi:MAG: TIGR03960 family B12-binding radical SAM protein, partial [Planctomycetes bacterium]|nr:TIGR03960 family B12-binding radical SAM protein [Planctomycetota bacterium]